MWRLVCPRKPGGIAPSGLQSPLVPERAALPVAMASALRIVFESSAACIETPPDVANPMAKSAFRYISQRLDTRQPDLGSGTARRGGSSPSSSAWRLGPVVHSLGLGVTSVPPAVVDFASIARSLRRCCADQTRIVHEDAEG